MSKIGGARSIGAQTVVPRIRTAGPQLRPNLAEPARPSESGRTQIWDGRPNPAELRLGTAVRIRPNSDLGRPLESGRTQIGDDRPNPAEKHIKHDRNQSFSSILHVLDPNFVC